MDVLNHAFFKRNHCMLLNQNPCPTDYHDALLVSLSQTYFERESMGFKVGKIEAAVILLKLADKVESGRYQFSTILKVADKSGKWQIKLDSGRYFKSGR
jgi:hypothetical protein